MTKKVPITIFYPTDVFGSRIGGIDTFIKGFIKYAPENFEIELDGVTENPGDRPPRQRMAMQLGNKTFFNNPILHVPDPNSRSRIPLSLKYTAALWMQPVDIRGRIIEFHRLEPSIAFVHKRNKKIYFCHGNIQMLSSDMGDAKWKHLNWLYFLLERRLIEKIDRTFVVNEVGLAFYRRKYHHLAGRFHFLPTYVDDQIFFPLLPQESIDMKLKFLHQQNLNPDSRLVLFAGRLELPKDPFLLLHAFRLIRQQFEQVQLLIVGDGSLKSQMVNDVRQSGMTDAVHFLSALPQQKVAELMQISDLFMLTSSFEGMPICVLESLACGLPLVSTDVGGVRRFIIDGYSGFVVSDRQPEHIACAALKILRGESDIKPSNCVESITPYFEQNALKPLYDYHYQIMDETD